MGQKQGGRKMAAQGPYLGVLELADYCTSIEDLDTIIQLFKGNPTIAVWEGIIVEKGKHEYDTFQCG
jgi:hypothetical protein